MPLDLTAVIPLKALSAAKGRLAPHLSPQRRRDLTTTMFRHVAASCLAAPPVTRVLVVAGDADAALLGESVGAEVLVPPSPGLHAALALVDRHLAGASATLIVAADLPLLSIDDVEAVCAAGHLAEPGPRGAVVVAPTHDGGTGGLLRRPGDVIGSAFGPGSAAAHRRLAAEAGIAATTVERDGFALDVDTVGQLRALAGLAPPVARFAS